MSHQVSVSYRAILKLAAPVCLSLFLPQVSFFTNTAFLGRLGEQELGINGVAGIFYLLLQMIGYGFATGIQTQLSRRSGETEDQLLGRTLSNGFLMALLLSLGLLLVGWFVSPIIFSSGMHSPENAQLATSFLHTRMWGLVPLLLLQIFQAFFLATGRTGILIIGSAVLVAANVVLDYGLIFGHFGLPEMGLNGAAMASALAEVAELLVLAAIFYFRKFHIRYGLNKLHLRPNFALSQTTLRVASPLMLQYAFSIGGWEIFFLMIEHLGTRAMAASQILRSIFGLLGLTTWAFSSVTSSMVSNLMGQGKESEVLRLVGKIARVSFGLTTVLAGLLLLFGDTFLLMYRDDPALIAYSMPSMYMIVAATLILSVATVCFNGVVGTGNTRISLLMEMTCVALYLIYCFVVIKNANVPLHWAWGAEFVYWSGLLLLSVGYLRSGRWRGKQI